MGFKYVNGHPKNTRDGLQTVTAFGFLSDVATVYPVLMTVMTILTRRCALPPPRRWVAQHLMPHRATVMALIGNGAQSEFQALAFKAICGIDEVRLFDIDPSATRRCAANLAGRGLKVTACDSAQEAVLGADIITTVTADKTNATILTDNMVGEGLCISTRWAATVRARPSCTAISSPVANLCRITPADPDEGEIQQLPADHPVTEFWQVLIRHFQGADLGQGDYPF